jgi:energy-coupling factor transporter transmembrane protein EcfT
LIVALALIVAIIIPFTQKKYKEWKAKISFKLYLKKYFGIIFNILTYDKIEYIRPSIKDDPEKLQLTLRNYIEKFDKDFKEYQNTVQYLLAISLFICPSLSSESLFLTSPK